MQLQQFLHQEVRRAQPVLIPYHLPTTRPLEAPPTKVIKLLWSDVKAMSTPTCACSCKQFLLEHCRADTVDGHVVTGLETLTLPSSMQHFQDMGGAKAYYDNKRRFFNKSTQTMARWMQHHQFPNYLGAKRRFQQFLEEQWQLHSQTLRSRPRYTVGGVKYLKSFIPNDFVCQQPHHAVLLSGVLSSGSQFMVGSRCVYGVE